MSATKNQSHQFKFCLFSITLFVSLLSSVGSASTDAKAVSTAPAPVQDQPESLCGTFADVDSSSDFYEGSVFMGCRAVIIGYPCGTPPAGPCYGDNLSWYPPNNSVTRGQLTKIVVLSHNIPIINISQVFEDVPPSNTFYTYINTLYYDTLISGYPCGSNQFEPCVPPNNRNYFRWGSPADRATIAKAAIGWVYSPVAPATPTFRDVPASNPSYPWIEVAYARGVLEGYIGAGATNPCTGLVEETGVRYFRPCNNTTRGQIAKILTNARFAHAQGYNGSNNYDYGYPNPLPPGLRTIPSGSMSFYSPGSNATYNVEPDNVLFKPAALQWIRDRFNYFSETTAIAFKAIEDFNSNCSPGTYSSYSTNMPGGSTFFLRYSTCGSSNLNEARVYIGNPNLLSADTPYFVLTTWNDTGPPEYYRKMRLSNYRTDEFGNIIQQDDLDRACYFLSYYTGVSGMRRCLNP